MRRSPRLIQGFWFKTNVNIMVFLITVVADYLIEVLLLAFLGRRGRLDPSRWNIAGIVTCRVAAVFLTTSIFTVGLDLIFFRLALTQLILAWLATDIGQRILGGLTLLYIFGWLFGFGRLLALKTVSINHPCSRERLTANLGIGVYGFFDGLVIIFEITISFI